MYEKRSKEELNGGSGGGSHFDSQLSEFGFTFWNLEDMFRQFFGERDLYSFDFFEDPLNDFCGTRRAPVGAGAMAQAAASLPSVDFHLSEEDFFFYCRIYFRQVIRSQGPHFTPSTIFGGSGMGNFKYVPTSTKVVNGRKGTTKRIVENGQKRIGVKEDYQLKS